MKACDLMIGDWVNLYDSPIKINIDDLGVIERDETYDKGVHCGPIPLTKEILEKNGFGFCDVHEGYYCQHGSVWTGWWIYEDLELAVTDYEAKWPVWLNIPDTNIKVEYVHELQHALKLCGIDKEIIL